MRGIYEIGIERPEGGALVYVGQGKVVEKRQKEHLTKLNLGTHENSRLQRAFDKYGLAPGWFRVLELVPDNEALTPRELFWYETRLVERGRERVMNLCVPSDSPMNDPAVRALQLEGCAKRGAEWRENIGASNRARLAKNYVFISPDGERVEVYSLRAFCKEHGLDQSAMTKTASGKATHHKGWTAE